MNKVSIIIPVYKVEESMLLRCIESVLNQSYTNIEVILINDGSPDNGGKICESFMSDKRVSVYHKNNGGVSSARNLGLKIASGEYVTFIDSDDYIDENYIDVLLRVAQEKQSDLVFCNYVYVDEQGHPLHRAKETGQFTHIETKKMKEYLFYMSFSVDISAIFGCLYKKSLFKNLKFNENMIVAEDVEMKYRLIDKSKNVYYIDQNLMYYTIRKNSAMRGEFNIRMINTISEMKKLCNEISLESNQISNAALCRYVNLCFVILKFIPKDNQHSAYRKLIEKEILINRLKVLKDRKARKKVKLALCSTFFGFKFTNWISTTLH
ncbi:glycosyltransferase family 2 protein [Bacillus sp. AFS029533]|uniref:glycosyltransferase family 2 protein n=1 Tax=Bacillus sp. AFS029533 TaxID=2033494 RepID=UPI000BFDA336|nr:glycosyltransferase family 2 protein [Bacillus sp. AFS029533]PGZ91713.1 hypothetical protein COE53_13640 [Bacillus sp. AFS029533]